jgi:[ribosomal protein S5]-alanine N-acetyltransferase
LAGEQGNLLSCFCFEDATAMPVILETSRLVLRTLEAADAHVIVRELNNFAISRNTARVPYPYHHDDAVDFLQFVETLDHRSCVAGVTFKSEPQGLIGIISYEWSDPKKDAELGYWYAQDVWGKGIGTEASEALVRHAFTANQHPKLVACYHDDNPASGRVLEKLGFKTVGACSNFSKAQGRDVAVTNMELQRTDWVKKKAAQ